MAVSNSKKKLGIEIPFGRQGGVKDGGGGVGVGHLNMSVIVVMHGTTS